MKKRLTDRQYERFWSLVLKTDHCWRWLGVTSDLGIAVAHIGTRTARAHVVSWELTHGSVPPKKMVRRTCGSPICVRPEHLALVPRATNLGVAITHNREKKKCKHGHQEWQVYMISGKPERRCKACNRDTCRRYREAKASRENDDKKQGGNHGLR